MDLKLLKEERRKKGFTQQYMAEKLGFKDKSSYCLIEKGKASVDIEIARKISEILSFSEGKTFEIFFAPEVQETSTNLNSILAEGQNKWEQNLQRQ